MNQNGWLGSKYVWIYPQILILKEVIVDIAQKTWLGSKYGQILAANAGWFTDCKMVH